MLKLKAIMDSLNCFVPVSEEAQLSKEISKQLKKDAKKKLANVLLLGTGEAGKSTFVKQMKLIHGGGFTNEDKTRFREDLVTNVTDSVVTLSREMMKLGIAYKDDSLKTKSELIMNGVRIDDKRIEIIERFWQDQGVKECFSRRNEFQLTDSASYFLDNARRITSDDFEPTDMDILMSRKATVGISEFPFVSDLKNMAIDFNLIDVGGQRWERKKWVKMFDGVTAVIFLTAISEYDQVLLEDGKTNRLLESRDLFIEILKNVAFQNSDVVLFLNKKDVFEEKMKSGSFNNYITLYKGKPDDAGAAIHYIKSNIFEKAFNAYGTGKTFYCHVTQATDTSNAEKLFSYIYDIVFERLIGDLPIS